MNNIALAQLLPPEKNESLIYLVIGVGLSILVFCYVETTLDETQWLAALAILASGITVVFYVVGPDVYFIDSAMRHLLNRWSPQIEHAFLDYNIYIQAWENIMAEPHAVRELKKAKGFQQRIAAARPGSSYNKPVDFLYLKEYVETYIQNAVASAAMKKKSWYVRLLFATTFVSFIVLEYLPFVLAKSPFDGALVFVTLPFADLLPYQWSPVIVPAVLLLAGLLRGRHLLKESQHVAEFLYFQTLVATDALSHPKQYGEGEEKASLRGELTSVQQALIRNDWSVFETRYAELRDAVASIVNERLSTMIFPRVAYLWSQFIKESRTGPQSVKARRQLGWLVYLAHQKAKACDEKGVVFMGLARDFIDRLAGTYSEDTHLARACEIDNLLDFVPDEIVDNKDALIVLKSALWAVGWQNENPVEDQVVREMFIRLNPSDSNEPHFKPGERLKVASILLRYCRDKYSKNDGTAIWPFEREGPVEALKRFYTLADELPTRKYALCTFIRDRIYPEILEGLVIVAQEKRWQSDLDSPEVRTAIGRRLKDSPSKDFVNAITGLYGGLGYQAP